jgi:hypothetical protein
MVAAIKYSKMPVKPFQHRGPQVDLTSRMKALRELQRTLMESEGLSKRDALDLDGPKFKLVLSESIRLFERALMDGGIDGSHAQSVMVRFADLLKENDETLRRDLNMIGASGDEGRQYAGVAAGFARRGMLGDISPGKRLRGCRDYCRCGQCHTHDAELWARTWPGRSWPVRLFER